MGFWFCNFQEFERRLKGDKRLILNFYYYPENGENSRSEKIFCKTKINIPTEIISLEESEKVRERILKSEKLMNHFRKDFEKRFRFPEHNLEYNSDILNYFLTEENLGDKRVLTLKLPHNKELIDELHYKFQTGDYDKLLKLSGFYTERKVSNDFYNRTRFEKTLEKIIQDGRECNLCDVEDFFHFDFLSEEEVRNAPWIYFDIEKPLWKKPHEKNLINRRKKMLKYSNSKNGEYAGESSKKRIDRIVKRLEDRLTIEVEGVGRVGLYESRFDALVSSIAAIWDNCNGKNQEKEVYLLDENQEFKQDKIKDYNVLTFKTENELIKHFIEKVNSKKPLFFSGHNEVYDITQINFAASDHKIDFNPAIKGVRPRRDFVRDFYQRLKQDGIYVDSMWTTKRYNSFLGQRSLGSSFKLASVAQHHGSEFEKSLTHEELRFVEIQRIAGKTPKIRKKAAEEIFSYVCGDVDPVKKIIQESNYLSLISKAKLLAPYLTTTEIAFSNGCMSKVHDKKHFEYARNHRYFGYKQKIRENESEIFKKKFPFLKNKMLDWAKINRGKVKGVHKNVHEIYLPFEEWTIDSIFKYAPEFKGHYNSLNSDEKLSSLSDFKAFQKDMLIDYYFARREGKIFNDYQIDKNKFEEIERRVDKSLLDSFSSSFHFLKNHFRSVYVSLDGDDRRLLRENRNSDLQPTLFDVDYPCYPLYMKNEANLFLLRKNSRAIMRKLDDFNQKNLNSFLKNFETFENLKREIGTQINNLDNDAGELAFLYLSNRRKEMAERIYAAKYKQDVSLLTGLIKSAYKNLKVELDKYRCQIIDQKGDYLFVKGQDNLKESGLWYPVREIDSYTVN